MFTILLHSSKTMRNPERDANTAYQTPAFSKDVETLAKALKSLSKSEIKIMMGLSDSMTEKTSELIKGWDSNNATLPAIDAFLGDIYSGLQVQSFSAEDRSYANEHLFILSGLYGVLRGLDSIQPYRLEMGYAFPPNTVRSSKVTLYSFWGDKIAKALPNDQPIINLSAVEYTKAVFPHLKDVTIITPKFLTVSPKTGEPTFVTVHAKIARGAFARWLIQHRIDTLVALKDFDAIGYEYSEELSSHLEPVYVAKEFQGIGLSVRLS